MGANAAPREFAAPLGGGGQDGREDVLELGAQAVRVARIGRKARCRVPVERLAHDAFLQAAAGARGERVGVGQVQLGLDLALVERAARKPVDVVHEATFDGAFLDARLNQVAQPPDSQGMLLVPLRRAFGHRAVLGDEHDAEPLGGLLRVAVPAVRKGKHPVVELVMDGLERIGPRNRLLRRVESSEVTHGIPPGRPRSFLFYKVDYGTGVACFYPMAFQTGVPRRSGASRQRPTRR